MQVSQVQCFWVGMMVGMTVVAYESRLRIEETRDILGNIRAIM